MQLKGLVRFFTIALILICVYQLSFTWIVRNHESSMSEKASSWLNASFEKPETKYPGNKELQAAYEDSLVFLKNQKLHRLLDSTKDSYIGPFGLTTYQNAKNNELIIPLDSIDNYAYQMSSVVNIDDKPNYVHYQTSILTDFSSSHGFSKIISSSPSTNNTK